VAIGRVNTSPYLPLDRQTVRARFDRAAASYDAAAVVQRLSADQMLERLDEVKLTPTRVLDAGCGTGYALAGLARRYPGAVAVGLDLSRGMLTAARAGAGAVPLACGEVERLPLADASMDLVFSNLVLHWCDAERVLAEFRRVLAPGGLLTFSCAGPDTFAQLRTAWAAADGSVHVHAFYDMHDLGDALVRAGFAEPVMDVDRYTLTYRDLPALVADLRALGVGNAAPGRPRGLTGRGRYDRFHAALTHASGGREPIELDYELVYGHAWAPGSPSIQVAAPEVSR